MIVKDEEWTRVHSSFCCKGGLFCLKKTNTAATVEALLTPVIEGLGYRLWDVEFRKVGADPTLTVTIDSDEGITIDDCERVHRTIDPLLDEADPIEVAYILEVSSPGIERDIRTDRHIAACMGEEIECRLFAPLDGKRAYVGILSAYENGTLTLETPTGDVQIPRAAISRMNTTYHE